MIKRTESLALIICILAIFINNDSIVRAKGGRGGGGRVGGGGSRSGGSARSGSGVRSGGIFGGSRVGTSGSSAGGSIFRSTGGSYSRNTFTPVRTGGGVRWTSVGSGLIAYNLMSNLAMNRHYHHSHFHYGSDGHYYRGNYHRGESSSADPNASYAYYETGEECTNNEDFNGTTFGTFRCPIEGFDREQKYCCGSKSEERQYCCRYFDDTSRRVGVLLLVFAIISIVFCSIFLVLRYQKQSRANFFKRRNDGGGGFNGGSSVPASSNIRNINRPQAMPMGPMPTNRNYAQDGGGGGGSANVPLMGTTSFSNNQSSSLPYPTGPGSMPQPHHDTNAPPPAYHDVVKP